MATRMQQRRGTAQQWLSTNNSQGPVLNAGEIGWESDTNKFKIGDGVNHWVNLVYFTDAASALAAINAVIDAAPAALNTLNELAAAINDDPSFFTTIATNLSNHESDTTNVHGIADTSLLATKSYADTAEADAITAAGTAADTKISNAVAALTKSSVGLGNVDNTSDADKPVSTAQATAIATAKSEAISDATSQVNAVIAGAPAALNTLDELAAALGDDANFASTLTTSLSAKAPLDSPTFTGTVSGVTATHVGLGNVDNTSDANKPVSTATQTALDTKASSADLSDHTSATTNVHGIANTEDLATQDYVNDQIASSEDSYPDLVGNGLDWNGVDGTFEIDTAVTVDLTTAQTLTNKTLTSPVINTPTGITKSDVGLSDVDNTSDADKPVSTATQTALDAKLALAGGTMTGDLTLAGTPTQALHAATKSYVDAVSEGLHIHASVVAATTANLAITTDLEPGDLVDGVTLAEGNRVLVKSQTNAAQNGIYVVQASGAALRASDFNEPLEVDGGDFIFVTGGNTHDNTGWVQTTTNVVTIGTDPIEFTQFSGAGTYLAGTGLELTDNLFSIDTATTVDISTAQTLTNKTISAASNTLTIATTDLTDVTATAAEVNILDGATLSTTELNYVYGVTSGIQSQIDAKQATLVPGTGLDVSGANISIDNAELSNYLLEGVSGSSYGLIGTSEYLDVKTGNGYNKEIELDIAAVESKLQTDGFAKLASPTFTGTVSGITASMVGLGNVDNTSDANKPVSTATQTALDLKANLSSPALTGSPTAPTQSAGDNSTKIATTAYADAAVAALVDSAPGTLNTLNEIAAAINDDASYAATITTALGAKAPLESPTFTGTVDFTGATVNGISSYSAPTLGSTSIASGATVTTVTGLTLSGATLTGTLTAGGGVGTSGQVLSSTGSGTQWVAAPAPTFHPVFAMV